MRMWSPKQADVGLNFEPTVIVMLELRAQRQAQPGRNEVDLILYECAVEVVATAARIKGEGKAAGGSIGGKAVPDSPQDIDRKSTRLNSSHVAISYAVFC